MKTAFCIAVKWEAFGKCKDFVNNLCRQMDKGPQPPSLFPQHISFNMHLFMLVNLRDKRCEQTKEQSKSHVPSLIFWIKQACLEKKIFPFYCGYTILWKALSVRPLVRWSISPSRSSQQVTRGHSIHGGGWAGTSIHPSNP